MNRRGRAAAYRAGLTVDSLMQAQSSLSLST